MRNIPFVLRFLLPFAIGAPATHYMPGFTTGAIIFGMMSFVLVHLLAAFFMPRTYIDLRLAASSRHPFDERCILNIRKLILVCIATALGILAYQNSPVMPVIGYLIASVLSMCAIRIMENFYGFP